MDFFKIKKLDFSCFDSSETGELKRKLENEARWQVTEGLDERGKKVWNFFNRKNAFRDDELGFLDISVSGSTNRKATRAEGIIAFSFGAGCTNDKVDGFDEFAALRAR